MLQRHSIEELHGDERATVLLVNVVDGADVGMVQRRGGASFPPQALQRMPVVSQIVGKKLEGDETAETCVLGLVDHTHPAAAELFDDSIVRGGLADHEMGTPVNPVRSIVSTESNKPARSTNN